MNALTETSRQKRIQEHLISLGYVWVKHPKFNDFYTRGNIAIVVTYKMVQFFIYDRERKQTDDMICRFSKSLDEALWKKFAEDLLNYPIDECFEMMYSEIEKTINEGKILLQR
ncbi:MAG TPA: hypothetical protein P5035_01190 [Bacteroidales bacterium]|nr:hypothetical protein [Bacteroidales bacterium]